MKSMVHTAADLAAQQEMYHSLVLAVPEAVPHYCLKIPY
jgi:hypothetical protein